MHRYVILRMVMVILLLQWETEQADSDAYSHVTVYKHSYSSNWIQYFVEFIIRNRNWKQ